MITVGAKADVSGQFSCLSRPLVVMQRQLTWSAAGKTRMQIVFAQVRYVLVRMLHSQICPSHRIAKSRLALVAFIVTGAIASLGSADVLAQAVPKAANPTIAPLVLNESWTANGVASPAQFRVWLSHRSHDEDEQKFNTFPTTGWAGGVVRWRYNDSGRPASVASAAAMIAAIQAEQAKWSAVCNVQFIYDGTSPNEPSLVTSGLFDGVNVIGWQAQSAPQTGETGVGWPRPEPQPIVEGDIALNNTFNPDIGKTLLHELGHFLGLRHSNIQNVVMSGLPETPYASLSVLQADDVAGCVSFYGARTSPVISGTITNGSGIAGVNFCARPSAGVTCTASNASGAYSCTVPNGWSGTLHSPSVSGNRIPPQVFASVTSATTRNITAVSGVPSCNLDVDNNGLIEPATDGVAILRRMLGFSAGAFTGLAGTCAANTTGAAIFNATSSNYNVTGGALTRPATDGLAILRAMNGKTGTDVTNGLGLANEAGATNTTWPAIQSWLNSTCGAGF